jgi:ribosomal protein L40E
MFGPRGMEHRGLGGPSICRKCGYYSQKMITKCPQCLQNDLLEKQNKILEKQAANQKKYSRRDEGATQDNFFDENNSKDSKKEMDLSWLWVILFLPGLWIFGKVMDFLHWLGLVG